MQREIHIKTAEYNAKTAECEAEKAEKERIGELLRAKINELDALQKAPLMGGAGTVMTSMCNISAHLENLSRKKFPDAEIIEIKDRVKQNIGSVVDSMLVGSSSTSRDEFTKRINTGVSEIVNKAQLYYTERQMRNIGVLCAGCRGEPCANCFRKPEKKESRKSSSKRAKTHDEYDDGRDEDGYYCGP